MSHAYSRSNEIFLRRVVAPIPSLLAKHANALIAASIWFGVAADGAFAGAQRKVKEPFDAMSVWRGWTPSSERQDGVGDRAVRLRCAAGALSAREAANAVTHTSEAWLGHDTKDRMREHGRATTKATAQWLTFGPFDVANQ
jgi:hypothetical protein